MAGRAARILVVEDSDATRSFVCEALEDAGFDIKEASGGFQAIQLLAAESFDLVITDINMPELTGLEVIRYCRARHPDLPVVVISTDRAEEDRRRALNLGASDYVTKPFAPEDLVALCQKHVRVAEGVERS